MSTTIVGLGPMGRAMAHALLTAGRPVSVWNRTPGRDDELVAAGAHRASTPLGTLIVLSLTDYRAMYDILGPHTGALAGTTLVNLSSDTPEASRAAAAWAGRHGARFVTGGIMVPAPAVGGPGSYAFYSGPEQAFREHAHVLRVFGDTRYLGADPGLAQLFYQAHLDVFLTALSSLLHAAALVTASGVPAEAFLPEAMATLTAIPAMVGDGAGVAAAIAKGEHPGHLSTVTMMGATAEHILRTSAALGVDLALPSAVAGHYRRAVDGGYGGNNWTALYEVIRKDSSESF